MKTLRELYAMPLLALVDHFINTGPKADAKEFDLDEHDLAYSVMLDRVVYNKAVPENLRALVNKVREIQPRAHESKATSSELLFLSLACCGNMGIEQNNKKYKEFLNAAINHPNMDPAALVSFGITLQYGAEGIPKNLSQAYEKYQLAAAKNITRGILYSGRCKAEGIGTKVDPAGALQDYKQCLQKGQNVHRFIAELFASGKIPPIDKEKVRETLSQAVMLAQQQGDSEQLKVLKNTGFTYNEKTKTIEINSDLFNIWMLQQQLPLAGRQLINKQFDTGNDYGPNYIVDLCFKNKKILYQAINQATLEYQQFHKNPNQDQRNRLADAIAFSKKVKEEKNPKKIFAAFKEFFEGPGGIVKDSMKFFIIKNIKSYYLRDSNHNPHEPTAYGTFVNDQYSFYTGRGGYEPMIKAGEAFFKNFPTFIDEKSTVLSSFAMVTARTSAAATPAVVPRPPIPSAPVLEGYTHVEQVMLQASAPPLDAPPSYEEIKKELEDKVNKLGELVTDAKKNPRIASINLFTRLHTNYVKEAIQNDQKELIKKLDNIFEDIKIITDKKLSPKFQQSPNEAPKVSPEPATPAASSEEKPTEPKKPPRMLFG